MSSALSKLEKACRGKAQVTPWSIGVHSTGNKHADTWEVGKGYEYHPRGRRDAIQRIIAPDSEDSGREYVETLDYGDVLKMIIETPCVDKEDIWVEFIEKEGCVRVTAPGFSMELPLAASKSFNGEVTWNYKNGVLEVNRRK